MIFVHTKDIHEKQATIQAVTRKRAHEYDLYISQPELTMNELQQEVLNISTPAFIPIAIPYNDITLETNFVASGYNIKTNVLELQYNIAIAKLGSSFAMLKKIDRATWFNLPDEEHIQGMRVLCLQIKDVIKPLTELARYSTPHKAILNGLTLLKDIAADDDFRGYTPITLTYMFSLHLAVFYKELKLSAIDNSSAISLTALAIAVSGFSRVFFSAA